MHKRKGIVNNVTKHFPEGRRLFHLATTLSNNLVLLPVLVFSNATTAGEPTEPIPQPGLSRSGVAQEPSSAVIAGACCHGNCSQRFHGERAAEPGIFQVLKVNVH